MGVSIFYLLALIPVAVGFILWMCDREIVWWEWLLAAAAGFVLAAIFHLSALIGMTTDVETWSGQIEYAVYEPEWIEEYQEEHSIGEGDNEITWHTTEHRTHPATWQVKATTGERHYVTPGFFGQVRQNFADLTVQRPYKSGFDGGDPNIYVSFNRTGFVYPTTTTRYFQNKLKGAPSLFRFTESEPSPSKFTFSGGTGNAVLYDWPKNPNVFASDRLRGTAPIYFDLLQFDRMNTRLGPFKKVNVILVGFTDDKGEDYGRKQQAKWLGGKKNDLVVCYGGGSLTNAPSWTYVFGWTERDDCKRNIEKLMSAQPLGSNVLVAVEAEIGRSYVIKDWTKFDYVAIEPPRWAYYVFFSLLLVTQGVLYWFFHNNDDSSAAPRSPLGRLLDNLESMNRKAYRVPPHAGGGHMLERKVWSFF